MSATAFRAQTKRARLLLLVLKALASKGAAGITAPGANGARRWVDEDKQQFAVLPQCESIDFFVGKKQVTTFSIPTKVAVELTWWLARWWVCTMWCGLRLRLWTWAMAALYDEEKRRG